jgi:acetylornithine deacetylase/succinyl-diaminopimelate desuccinylase-like protein
MRRAGWFALVPMALLPIVALAADAAGPAAASRLAQHPAVKAALQSLRDDDDRTLREQIAIAQIPSPPYKETARARDFAARLRAAGLADVSIDTTGNVIGKRRGSGRGPLLVISAHLDSVFPEGSDVTVKQSGTRYSGMGIIDDARGLAAVLSVLRAMEAAKLRTVGDVWFVGTVGEEALGNLRGVKALFAENPGIDGFISVDGVDSPDEGRSGRRGIVTQATGSRRWEFTFTGPGGHSFGNFGNPSAVHALGRAVARIADLEVPADPKTTFNVGVISGGTGVTAIAASASMQVDLRSNSAEELKAVEDKLQAIVTDAVAAENARWNSNEVVERELAITVERELAITVQRKLVGDRPASTKIPGHSVADAAVGAYLVLGLAEPRLDFASTDSNVPLGLGIPAATLNGGGIGDKAHSPDEWYEHLDAWQGPQILLLTTLQLVGVTGAARPALVHR